MKNKSLKNEMNIYFETAANCQVDTKALINNLKPAIVSKCSKIKAQKEDTIQTVTFIICAVVAAIFGTVILLPDVVDLTNEIIQFICFSLIIIGALIGSVMLIKALVDEASASRVFKIRRGIL